MRFYISVFESKLVLEDFPSVKLNLLWCDPFGLGNDIDGSLPRGVCHQLQSGGDQFLESDGICCLFLQFALELALQLGGEVAEVLVECLDREEGNSTRTEAIDVLVEVGVDGAIV